MKRISPCAKSQLALMGALATSLALSSMTFASEYETGVVATGLDRPTGIVAATPRVLIVTQVPTPGIPGDQGGMNTVDLIRLGPKPERNRIWNLASGEPEPTNLALDKHWNLYWTCKSAGVILKRSLRGDISLFLDQLDQPSGVAVDRWGHVYFTLIPDPGVPGSMGGMNTLDVSDGESIEVLAMGQPEPSDVAVDRHGTAYWTCKTAGVILQRTPDGKITKLLDNLNHPMGIALDHLGRKLYFTEVPTPGVPGRMGGENRVLVYDLSKGQLDIVDEGYPEPTDITVAQNGAVFWTCSSAGVIVEARQKHNGHGD